MSKSYLPHPIENEGQPCPVCKRTIYVERHSGMEPWTGCSEFCARESEEVVVAYLDALPGQYCIFPCPECGEPVEGEWDPDPKKTMCSECAKKVRLRDRTAALEKARDALRALPEPPAELLKSIDEALAF